MRWQIVFMVRWVADLSEWPLVVLSVPDGAAPDDIDAESFYEAADAVLARGERFAVCTDLRVREPQTAARRKRFVEWARQNAPALRRLQVASATVVENSFGQGFLSAILWVLRPPKNAKTFKTREAALVWLRQKLAEDEAARAQASSSSST